MSRRQRDKEDWDRDVSIANTFMGVIFGALIGGSIGLGICVWVIPITLVFPGDTMVAGAIICGTAGYKYGEPFIDWLRDNWWRFW